MDNPEQPAVLSLCTGYAGLELGVERGIGPVRVVAYVEIEAFPCANLVEKMEAGQLPAAPIWTDLSSFKGELFRGKVDTLTAGHPCQPWSQAGKRRGADDERDLWPDVRRIIGECRPTLAFLENVPGAVRYYFECIIPDLQRMGYRVKAGLFTAAEVGSPQKRQRLLAVAHAQGLRLEGRNYTHKGKPSQPGRLLSSRPVQRAWPPGPGQVASIPRMDDGTTGRVDRLRMAGAGVCPAQAELAWRTLWREWG